MPSSPTKGKEKLRRRLTPQALYEGRAEPHQTCCKKKRSFSSLHTRIGARTHALTQQAIESFSFLFQLQKGGLLGCNELS
eukprot:1160946-Pelagomonas_calceolata.AAC.2